MEQKIKNMLGEAVELNKGIAEKLSSRIEDATLAVVDCLRKGKKLLLCGNGGSASQCSHIAAEFTGRFKKDRKALPAIALTTDISAITALANDYGFERVFERQVEALGNEGDVLIAITTSGNSPNIIRALNKSKSLGIKTIALLGKGGGKAKNLADIEIIVPSSNTPRIQEAHLALLHTICELVEEELFRNEAD
jgi:D-sedoheptulose 7-phosphate isomerase